MQAVCNRKTENALVSFQGLGEWRQDGRDQSFLSVFGVHETQAGCRHALAENDDGVHVCLHCGMESLALTTAAER